jgi:hypothetical protein
MGGDKAWYSVDGSDWSLATVPALPREILARPDPQRHVAMMGVAAAGNDLVAWGIAEVPMAESREQLLVPLLWASRDGRTWTDVANPLMSSVNAVAGGPDGFVAVGEANGEPAGWYSADGRAWQRIDGAFESRWPEGPDGLRINNDPGDIPIDWTLSFAVAGNAGYLVVGADGSCVSAGFCASDEAVIWTSADGRSWSRLPSDDRFSDGYATVATAWRSGFVVGGAQSGAPAIWISKAAP